ncbi:MAG: hypothetical protein KA138_10555 [Saprospiraceae bacterium]|nr:hypothetical protein [Lewinellaceae bacterium]MBP6811951.1 hypothetical protein [Saprospiraceae bacterium]
MRTLFLTVALLAFGSVASACDVCGCSIGGNYFGILPQFHRHFVGIRYSEQSFRSAHSLSAARLGNYDSDEQFRTADVLGRFYPLRRLQMLALVPYHDFHRNDNGAVTHSQGVGDASVLASYILLDTGDSLRQSWQHTLTMGGGIKLPTGRHALKDSEGKLLHENMQPGSGSTDFMLTAAYTIRRGAWGFTADVLGRLNTTNHHDYHFGNRVSGSVKAFYWKNMPKFSLLPNIGIFSDHAAASRDGNAFAEGTGGNIALATLGLDVYAGHFSLGCTVQQPVFQDLGGGKIHSNTRWMTTLNYIF